MAAMMEKGRAACGTQTAISVKTEGVRLRFEALEREYQGTFHAQAVRLDTDETFCLRENDILPTASVFKLCVLCEVLRQARAGSIDLDAPMTWTREQHRRGDGVLRAMAPGQHLSVRNMAVLMMIVSDNIATAALVDLVGPRAVTETMHAFGLMDTDIHGGLPGGANAGDMQPPVSSARDLCALIVKIYRREILAPEDCDEIIRIMRANRGNDMMPRYIPVGEDWGDAEEWIADKPGYGACRAEVGIVRLRDRALASAMFFKPDRQVKTRFKCLADYPPVLAMAKASRAIYDWCRCDDGQENA